MSENLAELKEDLAAAFRLAAYFGFHEGICNHLSCALDGREGLFLLNPYGVHWSDMRVSDLLVVDDGGKVHEGNGFAEDTALQIHCALHRHHSRAKVVLHTHMPYATALTCLEDGRLLPVHQNCLRFYGDIAYYDDYGGLAKDGDEGDRIADALGDKRVLFMANHGVIVVGPSIHEAFDDLYYLEQAARIQVLAMQTGQPLKRVSDNVAAQTFADPRNQRDSYTRAHFQALKRVLDRELPGYAD
jgi:ribulose-5-phosphate 4-epimerase/fuculose-1-phosphate aldolase